MWYLWLFSHESKVCYLNIIWITQFEWSFELWYFGARVSKITSQCVIWNAQFKWRSGGVSQLCIDLSNHAVKSPYECLDLKIVIWEAELRDLLTTSAYIPRVALCTGAQEMRAPCMFDWQVTQTWTRHFSCSGMKNRNFGLSCVHCVVQISQLHVLLMCVHCVIQTAAIRMIIQIAHFALVWKQSKLTL